MKWVRRTSGKSASEFESPCPVFVISHNRGDMLMESLTGLKRQTQPTAVVVHDNGSDDPNTLRILDRLERQGTRVVRGAPIVTAAQLDEVADTVAAMLGDPPDQEFIVTDCDVDLSAADPDAIRAYRWLLDQHPEVSCVGPMLTIRDIPIHYPLRDRALRGHVEQFWRHPPEVRNSPFGLIASIPAPIDTSFALHRRGSRFERLRFARRVYHPFEAKHLDWYIHSSEFTPSTGAEFISHWGNTDWLDQEGGTPPPDVEYLVVRRLDRERLVVERRHTSEMPDPPRTPGW